MRKICKWLLPFVFVLFTISCSESFNESKGSIKLTLPEVNQNVVTTSDGATVTTNNGMEFVITVSGEKLSAPVSKKGESNETIYFRDLFPGEYEVACEGRFPADSNGNGFISEKEIQDSKAYLAGKTSVTVEAGEIAKAVVELEWFENTSDDPTKGEGGEVVENPDDKEDDKPENPDNPTNPDNPSNPGNTDNPENPGNNTGDKDKEDEPAGGEGTETKDTLEIAKVEANSITVKYTCNENYMFANILVKAIKDYQDNMNILASDFTSDAKSISLPTFNADWNGTGECEITELDSDTYYAIALYGMNLDQVGDAKYTIIIAKTSPAASTGGDGAGSENTPDAEGTLITADDVISDIISNKTYVKVDEIGKIILNDSSITVTRESTVGESLDITANMNSKLVRKPLFNGSLFTVSSNFSIGDTENTITLDGTVTDAEYKAVAVSGYGGNPLISSTSKNGKIKLGPNLIIQNNENYASRSGAVYMSDGEITLNGVISRNNKNNKNGAAQDVLPDFAVAGGILTLGANLDIDGVFIDNASSSATPIIRLSDDFSIVSGAENPKIKIVLGVYREGMIIMDIPSSALSKLNLFEVYDKAGAKYTLNTDGSVSTVSSVEEENTDTLKITSVDSTSVNYEFTCNPDYTNVTFNIYKVDEIKDTYNITDFRKGETDPSYLMTDFGEWYKGNSTFSNLEPDTNYAICMAGVLDGVSKYTWAAFRTGKDNATNDYLSLGDSAPTDNSKPYAISGLSDFEKFAGWAGSNSFEGYTFVLTDDVDFSQSSKTYYSSVINNNNYPFKGTLDGNNHEIKLSYPSASSKANIGLITTTGEGAVIRNLTVSGDYSCKNTSGVFVSIVKGNILFDNCVNKANVTASSTLVGGFIATMDTSFNGKITMKNCINEGKISGETRCSGFVGNLLNSCELEMINCANFGEVTATTISGNGYAAGFVGYYSDNNKISLQNCVNAGYTNANAQSSAFLAYNATEPSVNAQLTFDNCYYFEGMNDNTLGNGTVTAEMVIFGITASEIETSVEMLNDVATISDDLKNWGSKTYTINVDGTTVEFPAF